MFLAKLGIAIGITIMFYGLMNMRNDETMPNSFLLAVTIMLLFGLPNSYHILLKAYKSKLHSNLIPFAGLIIYLLFPIWIYAIWQQVNT